jgi:hypothetical protein
LNEGAFVLSPTPVSGPDATDGLITIKAPEKASAVAATHSIGAKPVSQVELDWLANLRQSMKVRGKDLLTGGFGQYDLKGGVGKDSLIDWSWKEREFSLFGDKFSWDSKINSSTWVRSFLDGGELDKELGQNSKIKVVLAPVGDGQTKTNPKRRW